MIQSDSIAIYVERDLVFPVENPSARRVRSRRLVVYLSDQFEESKDRPRMSTSTTQSAIQMHSPPCV